MQIVLDVTKESSLKFCLFLAIIKSKMSVRHHLSDFDCERAAGLLRAGQSVITVASAMDVSKSVISLLKKVAEGKKAL
ncbi:hypothetical protein TNCV_4974741 [Trichonephila clavipes]|uniref:Uncharacterized protein n=1 Tax=Trichonephila clavipes TaxID=2585209 RepID=A0A8X6VGL8_TRICX|nr:hypothetical protein TNCV_4974741 [Trichonephila clavipes]